MKSIYYLVFLYIALFFISTTLPQIDDITRLPVQNPGQSISESTPVVISDNEILVFYVNETKDSIFSTRTTDGGATWLESKFVHKAEPHYSYRPIYLSSLKTTTGRLLLTWADWSEGGMWIIHSDDKGESWSDPLNILGGGGNIPLQRNSIYNVNISELNNGKIILSFNTASGSVSFFRESINDGETWSEEAFVFYESPNSATGFKDVSMISVSTNKIVAF